MLANIRNTSLKSCPYNLSKIEPYKIYNYTPPIFITHNQSVNIDLYNSFEYLNNLTNQIMRNTSAIDKIADGAVTFY